MERNIQEPKCREVADKGGRETWASSGVDAFFPFFRQSACAAWQHQEQGSATITENLRKSADDESQYGVQ